MAFGAVADGDDRPRRQFKHCETRGSILTCGGVESLVLDSCTRLEVTPDLEVSNASPNVCVCVCVWCSTVLYRTGRAQGPILHMWASRERERNRQREEFFVEEGNRASLNKATLPRNGGGGVGFPFAATGTAKP